jgi:hypothetical protein
VKISDLIAGYAALLATALALMQFTQWRRSQRYVTIKHTEFFNNVESIVEAIITNRGHFDVTLDFVAFGYSGRYLRSIWRRDSLELCSISEITGYGEDGAQLGSPVDGRTLKPGELLRVGVRRSQLERMRQDHHGGLRILSYRPCIWIEHSQSDLELCHLIRSSPE